MTLAVIAAMARNGVIGRQGQLPGRRTIVVTRQAAWSAPGVEVARTVDDALARAGDDLVFVAGGGDLFRQTIDRADRLYLTLIDRDIEGDTFFPPFDRSAFQVTEREPHPDAPLPFEFVMMERT